jgi:tRNA (cytidine/uridine-2'-O-)-methyltransferase
MFNVVLYTPQIPQNTGNIIRLCANTGCSLHLIKPLGFVFDSAKMRRSGLDYHEFISVKIYENWQEFLIQNPNSIENIFALTTHGSTNILNTAFKQGCYLLFGSETSGLPTELRNSLAENQRIRLPMMPNNRSLNLANTVSIVVFEAWRQHNFAGGI